MARTIGRRCRSIQAPVLFTSQLQRTATTRSLSIRTSRTTRDCATSELFAALTPHNQPVLLLPRSVRFRLKDNVECSWRGIPSIKRNAGERQAAERLAAAQLPLQAI